MATITPLLGDCLTILPTLPANSFDACITDPPYHLATITARFGKANAAPAQHGTDGAFARASRGFMGKSWDTDIAFQPATWEQVWRVLKPGAYLVAFGGTRTFHRLACAIEDAGFEIRDTIAWVYGQGFPKSLDVSKAIDKKLGAERPVVGTAPMRLPHCQAPGWGNPGVDRFRDSHKGVVETPITAPATPDAARWQGWGTALKPAMEPVIIARKPLIGTVAENVLTHGTGAINIDAGRVPVTEADQRDVGRQITRNTRAPVDSSDWHYNAAQAEAAVTVVRPEGRWPANLVHDGSPEVTALFPGSAGGRGSLTGREPSSPNRHVYHDRARMPWQAHGDKGTAARFFNTCPPDPIIYNPKAGKADRIGTHPTQKPISLLRHLIRLFVPPTGHVLDPFAGSGTTAAAAHFENVATTLIEKEPEYFADVEARIALLAQQMVASTQDDRQLPLPFGE